MLITKFHYTQCFDCKNMVSKLYKSSPNYICVSCLVKKNNGFPQGATSVNPCRLCSEPRVKWFEITTYYGPNYDRKYCREHQHFEDLFSN